MKSCNFDRIDALSFSPSFKVVTVEKTLFKDVYHINLWLAPIRPQNSSLALELTNCKSGISIRIVPSESHRVQVIATGRVEESVRMTAFVERLQHNLSAFVLWCVLLAIYLGGAFLLAIGMLFASRTWWALIHQHASLWAISAKTAELFVMAAGSFLVLIVPFLQRRASHHGKSWRAERRSGIKCRASVAE